jgi:hypothetical protein
MNSQRCSFLVALGCTIALIGCVSPEKQAEKTVKEGVTKQDVLTNMGKPIREYSLPDISKCRNDIESASRDVKIVNDDDLSDVFLLSTLEQKKNARLYECGPIEYFTGQGYAVSDNVTMTSYERSEWITRVYPATATTRVFGNSAYTTFYEGGTSTTQKRCTVNIYFVNDVVDQVRFIGNDCPR